MHPAVHSAHCRKVLFGMCAGNELFYACLYLAHFTTGPLYLFYIVAGGEVNIYVGVNITLPNGTLVQGWLKLPFNSLRF